MYRMIGFTGAALAAAMLLAPPASALTRIDPTLGALSSELSGIEQVKKKKKFKYAYKWKDGRCKYSYKATARGFKEEYKCK
jgi:hypothetical protein